MTGWRERTGAVLAACVGIALAGGPAVAGTGADHRTLFRFADPAITESSGLVDDGTVVHTTNDSGAGPQLYSVDPATGATAGVTTYSDAPVTDVEALAPGPDGTVWVGDIGDNAHSRSSVSLYRVRPGRDGAVRRLDLTYPDGPRDAETLLAQPGSGRLFVVSKTVFGGTVYAVPRGAGGGPQRLRPFAQVGGLVTDGAFFPDGRHVLLRGYTTAWLYRFPGFELEATLRLPEQRQGEAVAIGDDGRILLSSEGVHAPVLEVTLPDDLAALVTGAAGGGPAASPPSPATGSAKPDDTGSASAGPAAAPRSAGGPDPLWVLLGVAVLGALAGLVRHGARAPGAQPRHGPTSHRLPQRPGVDPPPLRTWLRLPRRRR